MSFDLINCSIRGTSVWNKFLYGQLMKKIIKITINKINLSYVDCV